MLVHSSKCLVKNNILCPLKANIWPFATSINSEGRWKAQRGPMQNRQGQLQGVSLPPELVLSTV